MLKLKLYYLLMASILFINCQNKSNENTSAEILGPNIISTELPEFALSINKANDILFFNRTTADRSSMQILMSKLTDDGWTKAEHLAFSTGRYRDVDPFITYDGKRLYFSSNRPIPPSEKPGVYNTWYVKKSNNWSNPILSKAPINSDSTEIFISLAKNGNAYFVSERFEKRGIVTSTYKNNSYQAVKPLTLTLNGKEIYASNPAIAYDEEFLIVAARDPEGNGTPDLFVSFHVNGKWLALINLGPTVNSEFSEFAPGLSKDQKTLYFTSERPGIVGAQAAGVRPPGDIYKVNIQQLLIKLKKQQNISKVAQ